MPLVVCCNPLRRSFELLAKVVKRFPHKLIQNHAQVKDKWKECKKKYITTKKIGVIENAPSK
jgi:hypothetical protein